MDLFDALKQTLDEDYEIQRELGGGGMSSVFLARDRKLDRLVVIKVLSEHLSAGVSADRFNREILVAASLQHPHIVTVHSAGQAAGLPYFIMPFVEGESLRKRLARGGAMSPSETVSVLRDVTRALEYAHERGIVHRDIKPDNILLTSGSAMIADFGVAKALDSARHSPSNPDEALTAVGSSLGTPQYMAPEQAAGDSDVDHRADIYALGITAYEMLTGDPPFANTQPSKLLAAHIVEAPPDIRGRLPDLAEPLASLVMAMLEKEPAHRPQSAADINAVLEGNAVTSRPTPETMPIRTVNATGSRRRAWSLGVGGFAIAAAAGAFWLQGNGTSAPAPMGESIAVLPFVNVGGDDAQEYFADGMTDELINALNRIPNLRVSSRTAVFAFKGANASPQAIAESLQVSTLLEGSVRHVGNRMRLLARLVDASDGSALWSQTYERELTDVFAVQDDITTEISAALADHFAMDVGSTAATAMTRGTEDMAAYDHYLRGRYFFEQRNPDALRSALEHFDRAIAMDAEYAEAYSGKADVLSLMPLYTPISPDSIMPMAMAAAEQAVALNSSLAPAYASLGSLHNAGWHWEEAETAFRRATELDPKYATAFHWLGENLSLRGRHAEAAEALAVAVELDPVSPVMTALLATTRVLAGDVESGLQAAVRSIELNPELAVNRMLVGAAYAYAGDAVEAVRHLEIAYARARVPAAIGFLSYVRGATGDLDGARELLSEIDSTITNTGAAGAMAHVYLGLGDHDAALRWLQVAADNHDPMFGSESLATPVFAPLFDDPRFTRVLETVGLPVDDIIRR